MAPTLPQAPADAGVECEVGERCAPTEPDPDDCGSLTLESDVEVIEMPGNLLVIFDRSGSMDEDWDGRPKYEAAGEAITAAIEPLAHLLTVGGQFFPSIDPNATSCVCNVINPLHWIPGPGACCLNGTESSCVVSSITEPDQINFGPADDFITGLPDQWRLQGAGRTPLQTAVEQADMALSGATLEGPVSIVILTDGEPNCDTDPNAVMSYVQGWADEGIKTYVVGLPGASGAAMLLDELAVAGGTMGFIDPSDPAELEMRLRSIAQETIQAGFDSCNFDLTPPAEVPDKLHLVVTENGTDQDVPRELGDDGGWSVTDDGASVELTGTLCDAATGGRFEALRFEFGCVDYPPLPPPRVD
ncbi:MAG: vWA domain-containing protein [Myxococcales bacterium]|jgi:hypothetical protein